MICKKCKVLKVDGTKVMVNSGKIEHFTLSNNLLNRKLDLRKYYIFLIYKGIIFNFVEIKNG